MSETSNVRILNIKPLDIEHRGIMRAVKFFRTHFFVDMFQAKTLIDKIPIKVEVTDKMLDDLDEAFEWEAL